MPYFVNDKLPDYSHLRHPEFPDLKIPQYSAPWVDNEKVQTSLNAVAYMLDKEHKFPEYYVGHKYCGSPLYWHNAQNWWHFKQNVILKYYD